MQVPAHSRRPPSPQCLSAIFYCRLFRLERQDTPLLLKAGESLAPNLESGRPDCPSLNVSKFSSLTRTLPAEDVQSYWRGTLKVFSE